jgi:hypothetical protein
MVRSNAGCPNADAIPRLADINEMSAGLAADNDEGIAVDAGQGGQNLLGKRIEICRLLAGLAVGKVDQRSIEINIVPTQSEDFASRAPVKSSRRIAAITKGFPEPSFSTCDRTFASRSSSSSLR